MDKPEWLDDRRRRLDEVVCWVISPACVCEWRVRDSLDADAREYVLTVRKRHCVLHGQAGLF